LVFLGKDFVARCFQIHEGYAARLTPRLTQKSTAQPLAFLLHSYGLGDKQIVFMPPLVPPFAGGLLIGEQPKILARSRHQITGNGGFKIKPWIYVLWINYA
jgi:hypothetical protein